MSEQNQQKKRLNTLSVPIIILYFMGFSSVIIYRVSLSNHAVADFFRDTLGFALRFILSRATYFIPFSLGEIILFISVPLAVFMLVRFIKKVKRSRYRRHDILKGLSRFLAFLCAVMFIFTFTLGVGYGATPIHRTIGLERRLISPDDLIYVMQLLIDEANAEAAKIKHHNAYTGSTVMPYTLCELSRRLHQAYINLLEEHDGLIKLMRIRVKPVIISEILSRMTIAGVYSFFTGEANINMLPPDYNLPFIAAHEMAHVMGISREDEANFMAFLVCLYSDDSYIRYSGLVKMIEWLRFPLFQANQEEYFRLMGELSEIIREEMRAQSRFWDRYRDRPVARAATAVNDAYLRAQGGGRDEGERHLGVATYGLVRDLAVIYLREFYRR